MSYETLSECEGRSCWRDPMQGEIVVRRVRRRSGSRSIDPLRSTWREEEEDWGE